MPTIAICFDTKHGFCRTLADRIAASLADRGHVATVHDIRKGESPPLALSDGVLIVAPIYAGQHSRHVRRFVKRHRLDIARRPNAFLSVSLSAGGSPEQRNDAKKVRDNFLCEVQWKPDMSAIIAGDLPYRKYGVVTRWLMKRIVRKAGGDTDTSRNYTYTDWDHLFDYVRQFTEQVAKRAPHPTFEFTTEAEKVG